MEKMKAIITNPQPGIGLALAEVEVPHLAFNQALVRVAAVSLNRGEVRAASAAQHSYVPGWDLAGTVERPAADGSGPKAGERVVGFLSSGAWAELAAVPSDSLAELPANVTFSQAAALPVAGLTALYALDKGGGLPGRNVLVTGASGGVGLLAVELAHIAGAHVIGLTHHKEYEPAVLEAGADQAITGEDAAVAASFGPYNLVIDGVGGRVLSSAMKLLQRHGIAVSYGATSGEEALVNVRLLYRNAATLYGFILFDELKREPASVGLRRLAGLVADGRLHPRVSVEAPWDQVDEIVRQLVERRFSGKAVLRVR